MAISEPEALLECRCGACRIILCDPTVRARTECLCRDCRKRGLNSAQRRPENALPAAAAEAIKAKRSAPVIANVFEALEHPAILAFVGAIRAPIPDAVRSPGATSFEELAAGKTIRIDPPD